VDPRQLKLTKPSRRALEAFHKSLSPLYPITQLTLRIQTGRILIGTRQVVSSTREIRRLPRSMKDTISRSQAPRHRISRRNLLQEMNISKTRVPTLSIRVRQFPLMTAQAVEAGKEATETLRRLGLRTSRN